MNYYIPLFLLSIFWLSSILESESSNMGLSEAGNKFALNTTDFVIYEIPSDGISIQYPKNWEITKDSGVTIVSPKENDSDTFSEAVLLNVIGSPNKSLSQLSHEVINFYNETLSDFELIQSNPNVTLGDRSSA
jgi:hypothetical protein